MPKSPKPLVRPVRMEGGVLRLSDGSTRGEAQARKLLAAALKHLPDGPYTWKLEPYAEARRDRANRYYWGVVLKMIAEETGHSADDLHEYFKGRHNAKIIADPVTGEERQIPQSTAKLSIQAFSDYLEAVMLDGAEVCGIVFPEPHKDEDWRAEPRRKEQAA